MELLILLLPPVLLFGLAYLRQRQLAKLFLVNRLVGLMEAIKPENPEQAAVTWWLELRRAAKSRPIRATFDTRGNPGQIERMYYILFYRLANFFHDIRIYQGDHRIAWVRCQPPREKNVLSALSTVSTAVLTLGLLWREAGRGTDLSQRSIELEIVEPEESMFSLRGGWDDWEERDERLNGDRWQMAIIFRNMFRRRRNPAQHRSRSRS